MYQNTFIVLVCLLPLVLGACSFEPIRELNTAQGKECVAECRREQNACENFERFKNRGQQQCEDMADNEYRLCETNADWDYSQCQSQSLSDYLSCLNNPHQNTGCIQATCIKATCIKQTCAQLPSFSFCDNDFQACYQNCVRMEDKLTNTK